MTDLDTLLDEATPLSSDVRLCLDGALQVERDRLLAESKSPGDDDRLGQKTKIERVAEELRALEDKIRDRMLLVRITQMQGGAWSALKLRYPPAKNAPDNEKQMGFNIEAVVRASLLTHGKRVIVADDGSETVEEITAGQWTKIFDVVSSGDFDQLIRMTLGLNSLNGSTAVHMLSKGSRRTSSSDQK